MFKEFNVEFQNVEMIGGADNLLENTKVTKVVISGDNKMSSLDSTFKNCSELDNVQGGLDLNGVSDIDNILEGNTLIKSIDLKNINNENISASNSFPSIEEINISGDSYNKKAMQNVIASKDWTFDNITYSGTIGDNIVTKEVNVIDDNKLTIKDTLEQKARGFEIIGQTYENLVVGSGEVTLLDELTLESIDGSIKEFKPHLEQSVCVEVVEGNTVQDKSNIYSLGELQEDGSYKIDILSNSEHICFEKNDCIPFVSGSIWYEDFLKNKIKVVPNEIYHALVYDTISDSFIGLQVRCYSKDGTFIEQIDTSAGREPKDQGRFTAPQDCYYINFRMYTYEITGDMFSSRKIILYKGNLNNVINSKDVILEKSKPISKLEILLSQPLAKDEKLYWNKSNKRYEIDRNGEIEIPIVNGDVIDLPRLYQREDTVLTIESGNIKPSNIKVEYLDID